jgi:GDP-mannose 6-dehydrogenase
MTRQRIAVLGLGYAGCVSAACLAEIGHHGCGVDRDDHRIDGVRRGLAPFYEAGLRELIEPNVAAARLTATTSLAEALDRSEIALLCVGTPSASNGNLGLDQLIRVSDEIASPVPAGSAPLLAAIHGTVFSGTCEDVVIEALGYSGKTVVVVNPEFLCEGSTVRDFLQLPLVVVGGDEPIAVRRAADLSSPVEVDPYLGSLSAAEMIKYARNAFHATKISFANEIGAWCSRLGVSDDEVMRTLSRDTQCNVSAAYLKPGLAFGGCLPRDLRAINYRASRLDLKLPCLSRRSQAIANIWNAPSKSRWRCRRRLSAFTALRSRRRPMTCGRVPC